MELNKAQKETLVTVILQSRFTPDEWERVIKPIVVILQEEPKAEEPKK
jgi:hypothetical protein